MRLAVILLPFLLAAPVMAEEPRAIALRALAMIDRLDPAEWSYVKTTETEKDGRRVESHDATQPPGSRWSLLSVEGRRPTLEEIEQYRNQKAGEDRKKERGDDGSTDDPDIDPDSIRLVSATSQRMTFAFRPAADGRLGARMTRNVHGTLIVNRNGEWPERFELRNEGTLNPLPGVKVSEFALVLTFSREERSGDLLPREFRSRVRGRAFGLKSLDSGRVSRFSEWRREQ